MLENSSRFTSRSIQDGYNMSVIWLIREKAFDSARQRPSTAEKISDIEEASYIAHGFINRNSPMKMSEDLCSDLESLPKLDTSFLHDEYNLDNLIESILEVPSQNAVGSEQEFNNLWDLDNNNTAQEIAKKIIQSNIGQQSGNRSVSELCEDTPVGDKALNVIAHQQFRIEALQHTVKQLMDKDRIRMKPSQKDIIHPTVPFPTDAFLQTKQEDNNHDAVVKERNKATIKLLYLPRPILPSLDRIIVQANEWYL